MEKIIIDKYEFIKFYKKMKELYVLGLELNFGKGICLSQVFTEKLCRYLYNLKEYKGTDFDGLEGDKKVEIKATLSKSGTTTINHNKEFDILYWMYFNLENDTVIIYKKSGQEIFHSSYWKQQSNNNSKNRSNISLNKLFDRTDLISEAIFKIA